LRDKLQQEHFSCTVAPLVDGDEQKIKIYVQSFLGGVCSHQVLSSAPCLVFFLTQVDFDFTKYASSKPQPFMLHSNSSSSSMSKFFKNVAKTVTKSSSVREIDVFFEEKKNDLSNALQNSKNASRKMEKLTKAYSSLYQSFQDLSVKLADWAEMEPNGVLKGSLNKVSTVFEKDSKLMLNDVMVPSLSINTGSLEAGLYLLDTRLQVLSNYETAQQRKEKKDQQLEKLKLQQGVKYDKIEQAMFECKESKEEEEELKTRLKTISDGVKERELDYVQKLTSANLKAGMKRYSQFSKQEALQCTSNWKVLNGFDSVTGDLMKPLGLGTVSSLNSNQHIEAEVL
jgi:hypothetical protein